MFKLKQLLVKANASQAGLARHLELSPAAVSQLVNHKQFVRNVSQSAIQEKVYNFLVLKGLTDQQAQTAFEETGADESSPGPQHETSQEDTTMLLHKTRLTPEAKRAFGIFRDPFDDLQSADEMWISPEIRYVRESMLQTAKHGGFIAVVGQSGAGKSTLRRDLIQRIADERHPILVAEPYVIEAEDNDKKGKTFKSSDITASILATVAPNEKLKQNPQARFAQLHNALKESHTAGFRHCLVIEEAHSLPIPTLKHLKRILELEIGFTKLMSVILIGQPELLDKLSVHKMNVREVVQRCEIVTLNPISPEDLGQYLQFKFEKAGKKLADIMDESAVMALVHRLKLPTEKRDTRVSNLYPLAIGNFICAAMNMTASIGAPKLNGDLVMGT